MPRKFQKRDEVNKATRDTERKSTHKKKKKKNGEHYVPNQTRPSLRKPP